MNIREFDPADKAAVISLWQACGLVVPQNDPGRDIDRKLEVNPELFLVGDYQGEIVASVMGRTRSLVWASAYRKNKCIQ